MGEKGQNVLYLDEGKKVNITVESEDGFIKDLKLDGEIFCSPEKSLEDIQKYLKWTHLTPVAVYTRLRFFMLKNKVNMQVDCQKLADAIAECIQ